MARQVQRRVSRKVGAATKQVRVVPAQKDEHCESSHHPVGRGRKRVVIQDRVELGLGETGGKDTVIFQGRALIRSGTVLYSHAKFGDCFQTGHNVVIRSHTSIGAHVTIGTNSVIEGHVTIGDYTKIQSNCFVPAHAVIGCRVFLGPGATITNDLYPLRGAYDPRRVVLEDDVTLGGGVVVCPGVRIGRGTFVGAAAVVTKDVPEMSMVTGNPGIPRALPAELAVPNAALSLEAVFKAQ